MSRINSRWIGQRAVRGEIHPGVMIAGLLIAVALAWFLARADPVPDGRPALSPLPSSSSDASPARGERGANAAPARPLYRWTDAAGVVHFTDVPPQDRPFVEVDIDPERNVVPSTNPSATSGR